MVKNKLIFLNFKDEKKDIRARIDLYSKLLKSHDQINLSE